MGIRRAAGKIYRLLGGHSGSGRRKPPKPERVEGVPAGLSPEALDRVSREHLGEPVHKVAFEHISSWKASGSYRLFLTSSDGHCRTIIFKNALYNLEQVPALEGFPLRPGPPEYSVYVDARGPIAEYIPTIFECSEVVPGEQFTYLMEDVRPEYERARRPESILSIAARLPALHRALGEWVRGAETTYLLDYGRSFSLALQPYVQKWLEEYARRSRDKLVAEVLKQWPRISRVHADETPPWGPCVGMIHGDFGPSNIMIHRELPDRIKLIDWEWAGRGPAHGDLASLLKGVSYDVEEQALTAYAEQDDRLSPADHMASYRWCQLERGFLDAGYVAAQYIKREAETMLNLPGFISGAARRILRSYRELA
jgi:aminoglycoside phosphotransferase (APT) family kinase protein